MGGYGSGKRWGYNAKGTADDSCAIDANWMTREGFFDGDGRRSGSIQWSKAYSGKETSSISYEVNVPQWWLRLRYRLVRNDRSFDYKIPLTATVLPWGGVRWWFVCALTCGGQYCGRRVGKLYLPPGGRYYGCRHCYNLTYKSCNESRRFDHLYNLVGVEMGLRGCEVKALLEEKRWHHDFERRRTRNEQRRRRRKAQNWA